MITYNFEGQNVIVSGGTRGIGASISRAFLEAGAKVHALYRSNDQAANAFKESLGDKAVNFFAHKLDVTKFNDCESFVENFSEDIHVLVNNSGIRRDGLALTLTEDQWDNVINTNLKGTFNLSKFVVKALLKNRYGRIINVSSIGGLMGLPGQTNYSASKAGQIAFAKSLSKEVAKRGITVNCVAPGFVETELIDDLPEKQVDAYKKQVPMKRFAKPKEIADTVLFLASKEASYITGATLEITGGLS